MIGPSAGSRPTGVLTPKNTIEPSRVGVMKGLPRMRSNTKNQMATTAAPMRPATMPSRTTERSPGFMGSYPRHLNPVSAVARKAKTVVRVAQVGRQGGPVGDRAPGVGMAPGAAPADPASAGVRPAGVPGRRDGVIALVVPVRAPLVTDPREVVQPQGIGGRRADGRRRVEAPSRGRVAPGVVPVLPPAAGRLLPLGLGRQPRVRPRRERRRLLPGDADHGLRGGVEALRAPEGGRR